MYDQYLIFFSFSELFQKRIHSKTLSQHFIGFDAIQSEIPAYEDHCLKSVCYLNEVFYGSIFWPFCRSSVVIRYLHCIHIHTLSQTFRILDDEERDDTQMRDHFKERWNRTPSNKLTQQLRDEGNKYKGILSNATSADGIVKEKYNTHRRGMEILSKSDVSIIIAKVL